VFLSQDDWLSACGSGEEKEVEEEEEEEEGEEEEVLCAGMPLDLILKLQAMRASRSAHLVREEEEGEEDEEGEGGCREQWEDVDHLKSGRKVSGTLGRGRGGGGEGEGGIQQVQLRIPQNQEREKGGEVGGEAHTNLHTRTEGESEGARTILRGRGYVDELEGVLRSRAAVPRHFCYVPI